MGKLIGKIKMGTTPKNKKHFDGKNFVDISHPNIESCDDCIYGDRNLWDYRECWKDNQRLDFDITYNIADREKTAIRLNPNNNKCKDFIKPHTLFNKKIIFYFFTSPYSLLLYIPIFLIIIYMLFILFFK